MGKRGKGKNLGKAEGRAQTRELGVMPKKKYFRSRAHSNPLNDAHFPVPLCPAEMDWSGHFPAHFPAPGTDAAPPLPGADAVSDKVVRFADIGCGFGGMLIKLAELHPDKLAVGMELRGKVADYVHERILALRKENEGQYSNISVMRTNAMKFLPNYFQKGQMEKLFFLFPDPHFKTSNHRRRIINTHLITEYGHLLQPGGIVYTITDVQELGDWMAEKMDAHPMFEKLSEAECDADPAAVALASATEEAKKVARNGGSTYRHCYRRLEKPRACCN